MSDSRLQWFRREEREGRTFVFDPLRRRYVALTPEEEVRQKVLWFLVEKQGVPAGRIAVEYSMKVNGMDKRADAVVFGNDGCPLMIVECKASRVEMTQAVLDQALRYYSAMSIRVPQANASLNERPKYLLLSNGITTYCFKVEKQDLQPIDHIPNFVEMQR